MFSLQERGFLGRISAGPLDVHHADVVVYATSHRRSVLGRPRAYRHPPYRAKSQCLISLILMGFVQGTSNAHCKGPATMKWVH